MAILGYVTTDEIVEFMEVINPNFLDTDIMDLTVNAMYELINRRIDGAYAEEEATLYQDGRGDRFLFSPQIPIVELESVTIIHEDETETDFVLSGTDRNIWWDNNTGAIWTYREDDVPIEYNGDYTKFPDRFNSVRLVGTFGTVPNDLVKQLQLMLILKQYSLLQPSVYVSDVISEKIGRYEYKLANASNVLPENQRKGIDGWIHFLFSQIPNLANAMCLEAV